MSFTLVFQRGVREDVDDAFLRYETECEGLGEEFLTELDRVFDRLSKQPLVHQKVWKQVRRALLKRFPYSVFYRVTQTRVEIVAVMYSRRDPAIWKGRAGD